MPWSRLFKFFTGGAFEFLTNLYNKKKDSALEHERIEAAWAKSQLDAMLQNRIATAGFMEMRVLTFFTALPFVIHVNLVGLDTNFGIIGGVSKWPPPFDEYEGKILLSFFGLTVGVLGIKAIASAFRR